MPKKNVILVDLHNTLVMSGEFMPNILIDMIDGFDVDQLDQSIKDIEIEGMDLDELKEKHGDKTLREFLTTGSKEEIFRAFTDITDNAETRDKVDTFNSSLLEKLGQLDKEAVDNTRAALEKLSEQGEIILLSNSPKWFLEAACEGFEFSDYITHYFGPEELKKGDLGVLSPELAKGKLKEKLGLKPTDKLNVVAGFGDSKGDMKAFRCADKLHLVDSQGFSGQDGAIKGIENSIKRTDLKVSKNFPEAVGKLIEQQKDIGCKSL